MKKIVSSCFIIPLVLGLSFVWAQENEHPVWTPEHSMEYQSIRETAISPDGSLIAYVVRAPMMEGEQSEFLSQIWIVSADGKSNVQYTRGEKSANNPAFSPDGAYLAFTSERSEKNQVWIMRVLGGEAEQLTKAKSGVAEFKWSPDGTAIAYTMKDTLTAEEEKAKKEKRDVILVDQDLKYNHLYTISLSKNEDGDRETQRLTQGDFHITAFDWSPDGKSLVFAHQPDPRINTGFSYKDISTVPTDSGAVTPIVTWDGADDDPLYSPDGKWIAFTSQGGQRQEVGLSDVYIISAKGGTPAKLADTPDRNAGILAWSKDSKQIYVLEPFHTSQQVYALPTNGKGPVQVSKSQGVIRAVSFDSDANGLAFTYEDTDTPEEVYISPVKNFNMTRLTAVNADVAKPPMGKTEAITWKSTDGLEIEGLLTYPVAYEEGRKVPLILNVHGGPAGVYQRIFTGAPGIYMLQYFAQKGYAILRPNPRGSSGYGKDFRFANVKDWGYGDYEDLMSGVDRVLEMGVAQPDSLCLMGWSYGGYMTSFMVTRTDRFKAASMGAGLPNLVSMVHTTDIPNYLVAHMGGELWEDYEIYEKHSAMYHIKNVTTPTQVIHGAEDLRVPFTQGQEFYVALKRLGVPTEMIVYPRTPHGPREPKFLMDVSPRILAWFEKHLKRGAETNGKAENVD